MLNFMSYGFVHRLRKLLITELSSHRKTVYHVGYFIVFRIIETSPAHGIFFIVLPSIFLEAAIVLDPNHCRCDVLAIQQGIRKKKSNSKAIIYQGM